MFLTATEDSMQRDALSAHLELNRSLAHLEHCESLLGARRALRLHALNARKLDPLLHPELRESDRNENPPDAQRAAT